LDETDPDHQMAIRFMDEIGANATARLLTKMLVMAAKEINFEDEMWQRMFAKMEAEAKASAKAAKVAVGA